jgi:hypothetical protein
MIIKLQEAAREQERFLEVSQHSNFVVGNLMNASRDSTSSKTQTIRVRRSP